MVRRKKILSFLLALILFGLVVMNAGCARDSDSEDTRQPPSLTTNTMLFVQAK
jgi:hypothetical protein